MPDAQAAYPLLRRRRRGLRWPRPGARALRLAITIALLAALLGGIVLLARRATAPDPARALPEALAALARGNYSAARNHALVAAADPAAATAQAVLARAYLALGEGVAAEGALNRALAGGMARGRLHHLFAAAFLLQGDAERALAEATKAPLPFAPHADRVRAGALAARGDVPGATALLERHLARFPRDARGWTELGRIRFDAGDVLAADLAAQRAVALDPRRPEPLVLRGEVVRTRFGLAAAEPWFDRALARDAYFHPALIAQAATLGELGRNAEMLALTRRALAARPGSAPALYLQAVMAARAGNFDLARAMLGRTGDAGARLPGVALLTGVLDHAAGQHQQAVGAWRSVVGRQPMNLAARRLLGAALLRAGDAPGALEVLRPIALRRDADSYTLTLVARAFEATGERDWAARFLDRAARPALAPAAAFGTDTGVAVLASEAAQAPGDPGRAVAHVRGLLAAGDLAAATAQAGRIAAASPGAPAAHLLAGDVATAGNRSAAALAHYRRAADLRFDTPTLLRMIEAAERAGDRREGANALALYITQNPQSVAALRLLANLQLATRDWTAAIATLDRLRRAVGSRDALLLAQLGYAHTGAGDAATGRVFAEAAYRLSPMNPAACDAYGWSLYEDGETAGALQLLRKAATIAPAHSVIRWHLAQALAESGDVPAARRAIEQALADPAFQDRAPAAALLKALG